MSSTHLSLHYHIVFGTKGRVPLIVPEWRSRLHEYLGGTIRRMEGIPELVGGVADHAHLLVGLKATHRLSDVMRDLKKASSTWVREEVGIRDFFWQDGYAAFTVGATALSGVKKYIQGQEEHHRVKTFREELVEFLEKAGIEYDPKYLD
jgi:REP element-mobilizing transposase RayT